GAHHHCRSLPSAAPFAVQVSDDGTAGSLDGELSRLGGSGHGGVLRSGSSSNVHQCTIWYIQAGDGRRRRLVRKTTWKEQSMKIAVAGATGGIGARVVHRLDELGHDVVAMSRGRG